MESIPYRGSGKVRIRGNDYSCSLYYSEQSEEIVLQIQVKNDVHIGNFLEVPLEIPFLCGELETGFRFSVFNLNRINTNDNLNTGISTYTFEASYLIAGIGDPGNIEPLFNQVAYTISDITQWGDQSIYEIGHDYGLFMRANFPKETIYEDDEFRIEYKVYGSFLPSEYDLAKDEISLSQRGTIHLYATKECSLLRFNEVFQRIKELIDIATLRNNAVEKVEAFSKEYVKVYGETTIEHPIDIYGRGIKKNDFNKDRIRLLSWILLPELVKRNSFKQYFEKFEKLAPIVELLLELLSTKEMSEVRVFLNIVQALETYHSRFVTNDLKEYKKRVENLVSNEPVQNQESVRSFLMSSSKHHVCLESRLADLLLANNTIRFDTGDIRLFDFPSVIAYTRHYFIHYDEKIRERNRVLSKEELSIYNRVLLHILEFYILFELGFDINDAKMKSKLDFRWGNISRELNLKKTSQQIEKNTQA